MPYFTGLNAGEAPGLTDGEAAGLAFASGFFSPGFPSFFSAVGFTVATGDGVTAGDAGATGEAGGLTGVAAGGLTSVVLVHAPRKTAAAAKTVNRIDLLIVFPLSRLPERGSFQAGRSPFRRPPQHKITQPEYSFYRSTDGRAAWAASRRSKIVRVTLRQIERPAEKYLHAS